MLSSKCTRETQFIWHLLLTLLYMLSKCGEDGIYGVQAPKENAPREVFYGVITGTDSWMSPPCIGSVLYTYEPVVHARDIKLTWDLQVMCRLDLEV